MAEKKDEGSSAGSFFLGCGLFFGLIFVILYFRVEIIDWMHGMPPFLMFLGFLALLVSLKLFQLGVKHVPKWLRKRFRRR